MTVKPTTCHKEHILSNGLHVLIFPPWLHAHYLSLRQRRLSRLNNPPHTVDVSVKKPLIKVHISGSTGGTDSSPSKSATGKQRSVVSSERLAFTPTCLLMGILSHLPLAAPQQRCKRVHQAARPNCEGETDGNGFVWEKLFFFLLFEVVKQKEKRRKGQPSEGASVGERL